MSGISPAHRASFDSFYLQQFAVTVLPLNLAAAALMTMVFAVIAAVRNPDGWTGVQTTSVACGIVLLLLAWLCRRFARQDNMQATVIVTLAFGAIVMSLAARNAYLDGRGVVATASTAMLCALVGGIVAQRYWHVVASWVVILGPMAVVASLESEGTTDPRYQVVRSSIAVISTSTLFYIVVMRVKRSYYRLLLQLDRQSRTDDLTGLLTRRAWAEDAAIRLAGLPVHERALVLYIDIDWFKQVNDTGGHSAGDQVLVALADALTEVLGPDAILARFGGDEFVALVLPGARTSSGDAMVEWVDAIVAGVGQRLPATISAGGAFVQAGDSIDDALGQADRALNRSKRDGRGRFTLGGIAADVGRERVAASHG